MSVLDRCEGPPCPRCGCQDVKILELPPEAPAQAPRDGWPVTWWEAGSARCKFCNTLFHFRELPQPIISPEIPAAEPERDPSVCPKCGGTFHAYSTTRRSAPAGKKTQYRRCENPACLHKGKSYIDDKEPA